MRIAALDGIINAPRPRKRNLMEREAAHTNPPTNK